MKRDISRMIQEYDQEARNTMKDQFYASDLEQIIEVSGYKQSHDVYSILSTALKAGFMIGRRS